MNDSLITHRHGGPLRAIVPGFVGVRSVKWLTHISLAKKESQSIYQQKDYKVLPSNVSTAEQADDYWSKVAPLQTNAVPSNMSWAEQSSQDMRFLVTDPLFAWRIVSIKDFGPPHV